jgi:STE24 endopeptidase
MAMNVEAATAHYIDSLGPAALQKAHDYTVGKEWMLLWSLVVAGVVTWLIVKWGLLDRIEGKVGERRSNLRAFLVSLVYFLVSAVLTLPWTIYSGWIRETSYGRTSQPIGDFLFQSTLSAVISSLIAALFLMGVYGLIRRTGKRWWLWSGGLFAAGLAFIILLSPVLIEPLFNKYEPVPAGDAMDAPACRQAKCSCTMAPASRTISPPMPAASAIPPVWRSRTSR